MKKIIMTKWLPASGKSTRAKELIDKNPWVYKRVNKDDLRSMIDNGRRSKFNEQMVLDIRDMIITKALEWWTSVIVDDTNLVPKHETRLREIAKTYNVLFEIKEFDTPIEECIHRDSLRSNPVWREVIIDMYTKYMKTTITLEYNPNLTSCIICDIDWTLALKGDRDIYDWSKVYLDTVITPVKNLLDIYDKMYEEELDIIIMSGRDSKYRSVTENWLADNNINYYKNLYMRSEWDTRCDTIIKQELYEQHIKWKHNVLFVIDDRPKVVRMRREQWLFVLDVNQTGLEF